MTSCVIVIIRPFSLQENKMVRSSKSKGCKSNKKIHRLDSVRFSKTRKSQNWIKEIETLSKNFWTWNQQQLTDTVHLSLINHDSMNTLFKNFHCMCILVILNSALHCGIVKNAYKTFWSFSIYITPILFPSLFLLLTYFLPLP